MRRILAIALALFLSAPTYAMDDEVPERLLETSRAVFRGLLERGAVQGEEAALLDRAQDRLLTPDTFHHLGGRAVDGLCEDLAKILFKQVEGDRLRNLGRFVERLEAQTARGGEDRRAVPREELPRAPLGAPVVQHLAAFAEEAPRLPPQAPVVAEIDCGPGMDGTFINEIIGQIRTAAAGRGLDEQFAYIRLRPRADRLQDLLDLQERIERGVF